ncbi:helix-turn-helix domain-containing protein [Sorangium sp. So ce341]|uniref:helix-turn-helix domain-containing protein n=1 Tax=Sorangium sp. So ce341 TaxID=3133302 RepID=UPI003F616223
MGLTQSSMSHRLRRLREALSDPLLVRGDEGLVPTPCAEAIAGPLAVALRALHAAVALRSGHEPPHVGARDAGPAHPARAGAARRPRRRRTRRRPADLQRHARSRAGACGG